MPRREDKYTANLTVIRDTEIYFVSSIPLLKEFVFRFSALLIVFFSTLLLGCSKEFTPLPGELPSPGYYTHYTTKVQTIFDKHCVACHSCYIAPCQLNLGSFEGVDRGASQLDVYANRALQTEPTRLFIDATTASEWRKKSFFPVVHHFPKGDKRNETSSILLELLSRRREFPDKKISIDAEESRTCQTSIETPLLERAKESIAKNAPSNISKKLKARETTELGMPYGLPALSDEEFEAIAKWIRMGAFKPTETRPRISGREKEIISKWESLLNAQDPRNVLVSRYLYEHLFLGHIYFTSSPGNQPRFFRLVRSHTPKPDDLTG